MTDIVLPPAVEAFVTATNAHDADALVAGFADDAVVHDDGRSHTGAEEIRGWIQSHLIGPKVSVTPTSYGDGRMVASSNADLPGGPWDFAYVFAVRDDRVTELSISQV